MRSPLAVPALVCVVSVVSLAACRSKPSADPGPPLASAAAPAAASSGYRAYGAPIGSAPKTALAEVIGKPDGYADRTVLVEGAVRRACTHRGCWMELSDSMDPSAPGCRVTFKDYGFFVPTDSAGSHARVEGVVHVGTVPAERVADLESEGAHFSTKSPDGTAREVQLVASGAELRRQ